MTNLNTVNGVNKYCGPAVLAAITGKSTDLCASVISQISGQHEIKAVHIPHLLEAFNRLGFVTVEERVMLGSLYGVIVSLVPKITEHSYYVILVPHHVVALEVTSDKKVYFIDNHTKHAINAAASARLSQRVERVWRIIKKPEPSKYDIAKARCEWLKKAIALQETRIIEINQRKAEHEEELNKLEIEMHGEQ